MRPVHPGEVLRDEIDVLDVSAKALAQKLDVPPQPYYHHFTWSVRRNR